jgi:holo-[acyl-carrier protein] synthase
VILGLGMDLLENSRVERELERGEWVLADGVFAPEEIADCAAAGNAARHLAACFAAKEAALKALRLRVDNLALFREAVIRREGPGRYGISFHNRLLAESGKMGVRTVALTITQNHNQTSALVLLED